MKKKIKIAVIHAATIYPPEGITYEKALESVQTSIHKTLAYIEEAGKKGCDIVCTHEDFPNASAQGRNFEQPHFFMDLVKATQDELQGKLTALAKQYNMLIAANYMLLEGEKIYNTSTLYGRDGVPLGRYKKVHLADSENWTVTPGDVFTVIPTDIGNIGFSTCYDMIFPETCRALVLNGADMIIHQTQGWGSGSKASPIVGEAYMRVRAAENSVYLIVAKNIQGDGYDGGRSMIVDNYGGILAETDVTTESLLVHEVEPDFELINPYHFNNLFSGVPGGKARQLLARKPHLYGDITATNTTIHEKYKDYHLHYKPEEGKLIMQKWNAMPEDEKNKYHW